jgi:HlyD family secretion protein
MMGIIPLGAPARIHTDAAPDDPAPAELRFIASRAEFTPKEVQTPDERVKLVYAVKLYLTANPKHRLMPGLSADAVIRFREDAAWTPPRW